MADSIEIINGLTGILGQECIEAKADVIAEYAVDAIIPTAVLFPENIQQVSEVVTYARRENLAIIPRGNGSKMATGNAPKRLDLVVCTSRMNHMTDVDTANLTITVEAGVRFRDIQARLATREGRCYLPLEDFLTEGSDAISSDRANTGYFLPIDAPFSTSATIGGIIACNSSGPRRLIYGPPRDIVLGVRFVAPNGEIVGTGGKTAKNVSGYDISKLMIGSLGSLGILCEITLRLLPLPERMETLLFSFRSFSKASAFANRIFETQLLPAAVEVLNESAFSNLKTDYGPDFRPGDYVVAVALEAFEKAVKRMRAEMLDIALTAGAKSDTRIQEDQHRRFWQAVGDLIPSLSRRFSNLITVQLNYPVSEWKQLIEFADNTFSTSHIEHTILAHTGSGVCLINLLIEQGDTPIMPRVAEAVAALLRRCVEAGGNLVVQRAPAELKQDLPMWGKTRPDFLVMKRISDQLDPSGIMSPGRFVGGL